MNWRLSTYWKCQLIGWGIFTFITYFALIIGYPNGKSFFSRAVITCLFGLMFTHGIRWLIKRLKVFEKGLRWQIVYLVLITIVVTFIANFFYVGLMDKSGILEKNQITGFNSDTLARTFIYLYYQELMVAFGWVSIYFLVHYIKGIKAAESRNAAMQIKLIESEAAALRAQMNPHFIFNSLNSIKSLINKEENQKAADYLTTFSKLVRHLFQNSDRREVSLDEELQTCQLYCKLEGMRFGDKVEFIFDVENEIDLKGIKVPALILQPFIENAIWHGLMPKETGGRLIVKVAQNDGIVECIIDDDGIGRELSGQYKSRLDAEHTSKGIALTQSRMELDKILNGREDSIQVIDKKDSDVKSMGTKVILTFKDTCH